MVSHPHRLLVLVTLSIGLSLGVRNRRANAENNTLSSTNEKLIKQGKHYFRVYWQSGKRSSCNAVVFAVGTAMGQHQYPDLAHALVAKGLIVAIVDPEAGSMTKLDPDELFSSFVAAKASLLSWTQNACTSVDTWLMGGHSAGGGTAHKVFEANPGITDAVFSVDPAARGDFGDDIALPGLYLGFSKGSCFVDPEDSSEMGYRKSAPGKRALAKVTVTMIGSGFFKDPDYNHCSIAKGCGAACKNTNPPDVFFTDVADSVSDFAAVVSKKRWGSLPDLAVTRSTPITWFFKDV